MPTTTSKNKQTNKNTKVFDKRRAQLFHNSWSQAYIEFKKQLVKYKYDETMAVL